MVTDILRYPVKSMAGETLTESACGHRGLLDDRRFAVIDNATGHVASAKHPRRWGTLLACQPRLRSSQEHPLAVRSPDGSTLFGPSPALDQALSALVGRAVHLTDQVPEVADIERYWPDSDVLALRDTVTTNALGGGAPGTFFDFASVHLVTTTSLETMRRTRQATASPLRRFRPNIVIDATSVVGKPGDGSFPENAWVGRNLVIGNATLRVTSPTPRCVVPALGQGDLPADPGLLRATADRNSVPVPAPGGSVLPCLGVYARIIEPGTIAIGDRVAFAS